MSNVKRLYSYVISNFIKVLKEAVTLIIGIGFSVLLLLIELREAVTQ